MGTTFFLATTLGRTAVLPNALSNERILLMNGILTVGSEPINDDFGIRLRSSCWEPGGVFRSPRDGWIMNC